MIQESHSQNITDKTFEKDQKLLEAIKFYLSDLTTVLEEMQRSYEDRIYRFYHMSFKVYSLQYCTNEAVEIFKKIAQMVSGSLNDFFETIITQGTAIEFQVEHNQQWLEHPRAIVEAFLHTKYFTEMMVKYGSSLETAPSWLPSGWAAILELYNQR
jgi:hypothetical protein